MKGIKEGYFQFSQKPKNNEKMKSLVERVLTKTENLLSDYINNNGNADIMQYKRLIIDAKSDVINDFR